MAEPKKLHIAMFPWLAFGHILPYLELAKLMAQKGHRISFISTPRNIRRLPKLPPNLASRIKFVNISLPFEPNLPENAEATSDIPSHRLPFLRNASERLQQPLTELLETSSPNWIFFDFSHHWLPSIAENLGIYGAYFSIFNAWSLCFLGSSVPEISGFIDTRTTPEDFTVSPKWVPFQSNVAFHLHEVKKVFNFIDETSCDVSGRTRFLSMIKKCDVILIRSCFELENEWLNHYQDLHRKPVIPVGLLPPSIQVSGDQTDENWSTIAEWLNKLKQESVIYIALGSEAKPSQDEFTELALGLEKSEVPFFWVLRKHNGTENGDPIVLPEGFEERTKDRGIVWTGWAPQLRILSHDSVGAFLTHCGWSSTIEGIHFGKVLIMLPIMGDQGLNARVMAEKKLGIEIPRNEEDGSFTRNSVAESIRTVMVGKGRILSEEGKRMRKIFSDEHLHYQYVEKFVDFLENYGKSKS